MINHLEKFFDETYLIVSAKYVAFIIWLSGTMRQAFRLQIIFIHSRALMVEAALKLAYNQTCKLLTSYGEGSGVRKIERLIKPALWSVRHPGTPSSAPIYKRARVNLNASPASAQSQGRAYPGFSPHGCNGPNRGQCGRGNYNWSYRPNEFPTSNPNEVFIFCTPNKRPTSSKNTNNPSSSNSIGSKQRLSPMKGKNLNWSDC